MNTLELHDVDLYWDGTEYHSVPNPRTTFSIDSNNVSREEFFAAINGIKHTIMTEAEAAAHYKQKGPEYF